MSAQRESNPLLRTGKPACSLEHLGRETTRVEGGSRTRACTGLQPVALPSWRPRQESGPPGWWLTTAHPDWPTRRRRRESNSRSACARRRSGPVCRTDRHLVSTMLEESGGIEPLTRRSPWFSGPVPHREGHSPRAAEESNLAGRFWRPARSQIATHCLSGRIRTCVDLLPRQVGNHYPTPRYWVTGRFRSGTAAFTARHAEPLHHGHHGRVEAGDLHPRRALIMRVLCS